ncbi:MAG TPA: transcriptional repressor [Ktedonobacteraceae bacterium]|nr:transcriptional repressor [Ktedonobacteraceae bacterium]
MMEETHNLNANAQAVLDVLRASEMHPTALEVYRLVKQQRPRIGLATVYRILHQLAEQGRIKELGRDADCCRYDARTTRHDHGICTQCGALLDIPVEIALPLETLQAAAQAAGIELGSHEVRLYGRCTTCQNANKT